MYLEIMKEFMRLGVIAFGGPAAHIAFMHERFVVKKQWLDDTHFLELISLSSVIPGPSSTELALLIGRHRGGRLGLWLAGISFIFPALTLVLGLTAIYITYGNQPYIVFVFQMIVPVIIAVIVVAIGRLSKKAIKQLNDVILIILAIIFGLFMNQMLVFFSVGMLAFIYHAYFKSTHQVKEAVSLWLIFWLLFQIGATLYGSGYVLTSYLNTFFVEANILSYQQMIDAITIGQVTPGPVFTTAGFVGYVASGNILGGVVGAFGIFLPGFLLISFFYKWMEYLRNAPWFKPILSALNAAAIGLMILVVIDLFQGIMTNMWYIGIFLISVLLLFLKKVQAHVLIGSVIVIATILFFT